MADKSLKDHNRAEDHAESNVLDDGNYEEERAAYSVGSDEQNAMDKSNIIQDRTRGAAKASGTYQEPDENKIDEDSQGNAYIKQ